MSGRPTNGLGKKSFYIRIGDMKFERSYLESNSTLEDFRPKRCKCGFWIDQSEDECKYCKRLHTSETLRLMGCY